MTDRTQQTLLSAIRTDNLSLFQSVWNTQTKTYCFGRFPILTLLYLYGANKILLLYEKKLFSVSEYTVLEEEREDYLFFRRVAGRMLRLYTGENKIVLPCEMLALMGKHDYLVEVYPKVPTDTASKERIRLIEKTLHYTSATFSGNKMTIRKKRTPLSQMKDIGMIALLAILMLTLSVWGCSYAKSNQTGTQNNPFVLQNTQQAKKAFVEEGYYALDGDMTFEGAEEWKGHLDGNGHTLTLTGNIQTFSGTLSNVKLLCIGSIDTVSDKGTLQNVDIECDGMAIGKNKGTLENVSFSSSFRTVTPTADYFFFVGENNGYMKNITAKSFADITLTQEHKDIYINLFGSQNTGTIENATATVQWKIKNDVANDTFASCFCGKNLGKITGCNVLKESFIETDTADIGGVCIQNGSLDKADTEVVSCSVKGTFSQTSKEEGWSPNVTGIAIQNYGKITSCQVEADMRADNSFVKEEEEESESTLSGSSFASGICALNGGLVSQCFFSGTLKSNSPSQYIYLGGIACRSIIIEETSENIYAYRMGDVEKSKVHGTLEAEASQESYIGGIVAHNYGRYETDGSSYSYFSQASYKYSVVSECEADVEISCGVDGYIGGAVAINYGQAKECKVKLTATCGDGSLIGGLTAYNVVNESSSSFILSSDSYKSMCDSETELVANGGNDCIIGGVTAFCNSTSYVTAYMDNCHAISQVTMGEKGFFGGLAGKSGTYVQYSEAEGSLQAGATTTAGGAVGYNGGSIGYCKTDFSLTVEGSSFVGGITGQNKGTIAYNRVYGKLNVGKDSYVGGSAGKNEYNLKYNFVFVEEYTAGENSFIGYQAGDTLLSYSYSYTGYLYNIMGNCHVAVAGLADAYGNLSNYTAVGETEEDREKDLIEMKKFQETEYNTEKEMKNNTVYKEAFDDEEEESSETEQGKTAVSFIIR